MKSVAIPTTPRLPYRLFFCLYINRGCIIPSTALWLSVLVYPFSLLTFVLHYFSKCQVSWATPWQEIYLAQTHFRKTETTRNRPHQNVLVTRTKVKTLYKQQTSHILKPIWTYGIQLWGTASTSSIEIIERFQSKALRMTVDAPWYVPNTVIRRDLQILTVKEEIHRYSSQ
jgi:hypothetical protein